MALPSQVEAAGKRADEIAKQMMESETPGTVQASDDGDTAESQVPPKESAEDPQQPKPKEKDLQHKYDVLKGKYNSEIKAFKSEMDQLKEYNRQLLAAQTALSDTVKELRAHIGSKKEGEPGATETPPAVSQDFDVSKVLSQEDMDHLEAEDLGGKTLQIMTKLIRAASGNNGQSNQFEDRLNQVASKVDEFGQEMAENRKMTFNERLKKAIPDFWTVNDDPAFASWLDETMRRPALQQAFESQDIEKVKVGIDTFKKETGWGKQQKTEQRRQETPTPPKKQQRIEDHIEPEQDFVGTPSDEEGGKRIYTTSEIKKFYTDQTKGKWRGREKAAEQINRDIVLAEREGRIRQG